MKYLHNKKNKIFAFLLLGLLATNIMADKINVENDVEASRFLTQATFGPTTISIQNLREKGTYEEWIDKQIDLEASKMTPQIIALEAEDLREGHRQAIWWNTILHGEDQLRLRTAYALSQIFVTGFTQGFANREEERTLYYDILINHSFSDFETLLKEVTISPIMGKYLSMLNNKKAEPEKNTHPDENYAREIMQLFTIGLTKLGKDGSLIIENEKEVPTYTQDDIENLARVFTGWKLKEKKDFKSKMICNEEDHDNGSKILLGKKIKAGLSCEADMNRALDILVKHKNTSVFISKQLIQKLVTSNPSKKYIKNITRVFRKNNGNLGAVIKAILLHEEARKPRNLASSNFGKFKEPMIRLASFYRATNTVSQLRKTGSLKEYIGQTYLDSPSVFNYFRPSYKIKGSDLLTPELQLSTDTYLAKTSNIYNQKTINFNCKENDKSLCIKLDEELLWIKDDVDKFIEHYNLLLFAGSMSEDVKNELKNYIEGFKYPTRNLSPEKLENQINSTSKRRAIHALFLMMNIPEQSFQQ